LILKDNKYVKVDDPRPGDLIIYRDLDNAICHSGIVKAVGSKGVVWVESKWGWRGRYLHEPEVQHYSPYFEYYRSEKRPGHLLSGIARAGAANFNLSKHRQDSNQGILPDGLFATDMEASSEAVFPVLPSE
jgi:hypothetical protein